MRVGFIGTGSMGSMLIETFIRSGAVNPENVVATNRTIAKAELLAANYPACKLPVPIKKRLLKPICCLSVSSLSSSKMSLRRFRLC